MKLTVLTDNNVLQGKNFLGEHGLSFYVEDEGKKILFDTGYSDIFLKNAIKMGIDLLDLDYIVLSHGHYDHSWGLVHYIEFYKSALKQGHVVKKPVILTHPETFDSKVDEKSGEIGCLVSQDKLEKFFEVKLSKDPFSITKNLVFLGEIPRINNFEAKEPICRVYKNNFLQDDYINEDSALVYKTAESRVVVTGCSHSGICNIIDYAKKFSGMAKIKGVIGGFHLVNCSEERLLKTVEYFVQEGVKDIYACHCTDFQSKIFLSKQLQLKDTGVGLTLEY